MGSATCNDSIETTKHGNGSKGIQGYDHLAWDSARKKNKSMKKANRGTQMKPHNSETKPKLTREATGKKQTTR